MKTIVVSNYATLSNIKQTFKAPWLFENNLCKKGAVYVIQNVYRTYVIRAEKVNVYLNYYLLRNPLLVFV